MTTDTIEAAPVTASASLPATQTVAEPRDVAVMPGFSSQGSWELANRIGKAFAASSLVPERYQNNVANCIVALEMANRMGASPLMVMQNLYVVHGTPGWSAKFLIACFNQCGRFSAIRYEWNADRSECRAWAIERSTGERIYGPAASLEMAKAEGWSTKAGSKWRTMPELMLMYRAAAFMIRAYAPEISMGLHTDDELIDAHAPMQPSVPDRASLSSIEAVRAAIGNKPPAKTIDQWRAEIDAATGAESAGLTLDEARDNLSPADHAVLSAYYVQRWEA